MSYQKQNLEHLIHDLEVTITNNSSLYDSFKIALEPMFKMWERKKPNRKKNYKDYLKVYKRGMRFIFLWVVYGKNKYELEFKTPGKFSEYVCYKVAENIVDHWITEFELGNHPF